METSAALKEEAKQDFLTLVLSRARWHEDEARRLRDLAWQVEHPPEGSTVEFCSTWGGRYTATLITPLTDLCDTGS